MIRLPRYLFALSLVGLGISASSCADNESGLFVRTVLANKSPTCVVKNDPSEAFLGIGVLDTALRTDYEATLLIGNQLVLRGSRDQLRNESSRITIRGAEVELFNQDESLRTSFSVPTHGFVDPGSGADPGYGVSDVTLIPNAEGVKLRDQLGASNASRATITAGVRVFGDTLGGQEMQSDQLGFPIVVCHGCLISRPAKAIDKVTGICVAPSDFEDDPPCRPGQDDALDCRFCVGTNPACL